MSRPSNRPECRPLEADEYARQSAERVERHAARAAAGLPLFEDGPPAPPPGELLCWGCGGYAPARVKLKEDGWKTVVTTRCGCELRELYCPECFKALPPKPRRRRTA